VPNMSKMKEKKSLGSWFPSASVTKTDGNDGLVTICLFYQYVRPLWSEAQRTEAIRFVEEGATKLNIGGRVRVAYEGLNATLSGSSDDVRTFTNRLGDLDPHFKLTGFKYVDNLDKSRAFKDMKVLPVKELVFYGINAEEVLPSGGIHLDPVEYHKKLADANSVVIDVSTANE
jgi:predicted sulfurtransferase